MSEQETYVGVIELMPRLENESDKDYFERVVQKDYFLGKDKTPFENIREAIGFHCWKDFLYLGEEIYKVIERKIPNYNNCYCNLTKLDNNKISFATSYYNGGTCFSEMMEEAFEREFGKND